MKRGINAYSADWPIIADNAKRAARWKCERCKHKHAPRAGYALTVHHLDMDCSNNHPKNLAVLCQRCHLEVQATLDIELERRQRRIFPPPPWLKKHL